MVELDAYDRAADVDGLIEATNKTERNIANSLCSMAKVRDVPNCTTSDFCSFIDLYFKNRDKLSELRGEESASVYDPYFKKIARGRLFSKEEYAFLEGKLE